MTTWNRSVGKHTALVDIADWARRTRDELGGVPKLDDFTEGRVYELARVEQECRLRAGFASLPDPDPKPAEPVPAPAPIMIAEQRPQKPSLGRIVLYGEPVPADPAGCRPCAAIITGLDASLRVALFVMPPGGPPYAITQVPSSADVARGYWTWPTRVS